MIVEIVDMNVLKFRHYQIIWYLFPGFKTIIFYFVYSIRFGKYVFSAAIWFVKNPTRIVKYEFRVVKSNTGIWVLTLF